MGHSKENVMNEDRRSDTRVEARKSQKNGMNDTTHHLPQAKIQKDPLAWFFWALPVAAAGLCGWFILHDLVFAGPPITIYFQDAQGLQEQNSMVRYHGIKI